MGFRINYEVKGHMSFLSHLEMLRLWQRALLRSTLPISWSQGFNPRPKISLGPAKGVGIEGHSEFIDVEFNTLLKGEIVIERLNQVLPQDVRVLNVRELPPHTKLLEAVINEAIYKITFEKGLPQDFEDHVKEFMAKDSIPFLRRSPKKDKELDLRAFVYDMEVREGALFLSTKLGPGGSARPNEIMEAMGYQKDAPDIKIQRMGLFIKEGSRSVQP